MSTNYSHILSPLRVQNHFLKNRIMLTKCVSGELQGAEHAPAESTVRWITDMAKNAAILVIEGGFFPECAGTTAATNEYHLENTMVQNVVQRTVHRVHAEGSLLLASLHNSLPMHFRISEIRDRTYFVPGLARFGPWDMDDKPEATVQQLHETVDMLIHHAVFFKNMGFDGIHLYMGHGGSIFCSALSPILNQRTDEYGGSLENRMRLCDELFQGIKKACGEDFLIATNLAGQEGLPGGYTVEDYVQMCRHWEGLVDIHQIGMGIMDRAGITHLTPKSEPVTLGYAKALKDAGIRAIICPSIDFHDVDDNERYLAEGSCDMIGLATPLIAEPEYVKKLRSNKGERIRPCIGCGKCHGAMCSVNPRHGLSHIWDTLFDAPVQVKRVAVIGGGPAGMEAAIAAARRGHQVTLFEREGRLGGQLRHSDYLPGKWQLKSFMDYLIQELQRSCVDIRLGTEAVPEIIQGYDAVVAACGSDGKQLNVPGGDSAFVWQPTDVFGNSNRLGTNVVVCGGGSIGMDVALYLASSGHQVTVITRQRGVGFGADSHDKSDIVQVRKIENPHIVCETTVTEIRPGQVLCAGPDGTRTIPFDDVVVSAGRVPRLDACAQFATVADEFYVAGDCCRSSNPMNGRMGASKTHVMQPSFDVQNATFTGYTAGSRI